MNEKLMQANEWRVARMRGLSLFVAAGVLSVASAALAQTSTDETTTTETTEAPATATTTSAPVSDAPVATPIAAPVVVVQPEAEEPAPVVVVVTDDAEPAPVANEVTASASVADDAAPEAPEFGSYRRGIGFEPVFRIDAELIGGLWYNPDESYSAFDLQRGELGVRFDANRFAGAEIRIESFRSAAPGSVLGLDGDSLALRIKRAQGMVRYDSPWVNVEARIGVTQDLWIESLEGHYDFRGMAPLMAEWSGFYDTSDVGAAVVVSTGEQLLGGDAIRLGLSFTNGEGRRESERNSGKDFSAVLTVQPVVAQLLGQPLRLGLHAMWRDGSLGAGSAKDHRRAVGLSVNHARFELGWEWAKAVGFEGDSFRDASGHGIWGGGQFIESWLGASFRYDRMQTDLALDDNIRSQWMVALFSDFGTKLPTSHQSGGRVRIYAGVQQLKHEANASPVPGVVNAGDELRVMVWINANGGLRLPF